MNLEPVTCVRCLAVCCYVDESYTEDVAYHLYCDKCVKIEPKTIVTDGISKENES